MKNSLDHLAEQNAVSSIDLVYFLLIPITLFIMGQTHQITITSISGIFSLLVYLGGLMSLPFALYAKMVDSISYRIRAWGIYILFSSIYNVFLQRVPSKRDEIKRSLDVIGLKSWIAPRLRFSYRSDALLLIVGLGIYFTFLIITIAGLSF